jgi:hypothetical protein
MGVAVALAGNLNQSLFLPAASVVVWDTGLCPDLGRPVGWAKVHAEQRTTSPHAYPLLRKPAAMPLIVR